MSWLKTKTKKRATLKNSVGNLALVLVGTTLSAAQMSSTQALQKGISVELAPSRSAVSVPLADKQDALIVTVTESGKLYFGIDAVTPDALVKELKNRMSQRTQNLYVKADARAPYAWVVKVLDAAHEAGIASVTLLTTQTKTTRAGTVVSPEGIEMELARSPATTK
jgi:biopolymer transport protein ExbD